MRQTFLLIILCLPGILAAAQTSPDGLPIESIDITGIVTLTRAQVLAVVRTRPGQLFDAQIVAEDARRIAGLDAVESAYYNSEVVNGQVKLTYVVVEHNLVRSLAFKGNKRLSDSFLSKQLSYQKGDYLDVFALESGVTSLNEAYKKKGYAWVKVTLDESSNLGNVAYVIEEGPRTKIVKVTFDGAEALKPGQLKKVIKSKTRKFLVFAVYYNPEQLEEDTEKLLEAYHKKSFLDASVRSEATFNEDKSKAYITFHITEGPAYFVNTIKYTGNEFISNEELAKDLKLRPDYFYSEAWADFDMKKIRAKFASQGFIYSEVEQKRTILPDARVDVEFIIKEGQRYRIGEVAITGNQSIQDRTVRRVMDEEKFTPGQWYNGDIAAGTGEGLLEKQIRQTVVTESAIIKPVGDELDTRDALVTIKEGQTGSVMVGAGVSSDSGVMGQLTYSQRNFDISDWPSNLGEIFNGEAFRGAGQRLTMTASPGTEINRYGINFVEPFLFDMPTAFSLGGSFWERERESYDENRFGGTVGLDKRYEDDWHRGVSFRGENVKIDDLESDAPEEIIDVEGNNMLYGTRFYIGRDTTDNRYLPTIGYNFDLGYEQVLGDHTFGLLTATQRWYTTLYEDLAENKTVLETKIHGGTTVGDAPPFEKFYVGGIGSMRGFDYRGISPRSGPDDDPIGSDWVLLGNAEVAVPLGSQTFSWLFFTDVGTIEDGFVRSSVGTGIQIMIPQFFGPVPMRFELAAPITKDDEDDTQVFSFSVGALF